MNLAQHLNRIYQDLGEANTNKFPIVLLKEYLDEAERVLNKETKCIRKEDTAVSIVANQRLYSPPTDILDLNIDRIFFPASATTNDLRELTYIDLELLKNYDSQYYLTTGHPSHWYIDFENSKYGLYPYPLVIITGSNTMTIKYRGKHTKMTYYYTTGTIAVANAGTAVTGSGTTFTGNTIANNEFGVGKLLDASRVTDFPSTWYTISTVGGNTSLTLSSAYAGSTIASGGYYIVCSDSSITNDEINLCSIEYAKGLCKIKDGKENAGENMKALAIARAKVEIQNYNNINPNMPSVPIGSLPSQNNIGLNDYGMR